LSHARVPPAGLFFPCFCAASGYYSVFIPAMEKLSRPYAEYPRQMQALGEKLSSALPNACPAHAQPLANP
jgi:hypothetical protein